jgi:ribosome-associated heat shock protein Hsp15
MSTRLDKWLWAARFFKTRSLATKACELGRVHSNRVLAKPSRDVKPGDMIALTNLGGDYVVEVLGLSEVRGPAAEAQKLYRETDESREARVKVAAQRKAMSEFERLDPGKPDKRDRREIRRIRGRD